MIKESGVRLLGRSRSVPRLENRETWGTRPIIIE